MEIAPIDDHERLFVASAIDDWDMIHALDIRVVIDLEGDLDQGVPTVPGSILYIYFPLHDNEDLPHPEKVKAVARLGADLCKSGLKVVAHCGMGLNRSALVAGLILCEMGWCGSDAVRRLQERRAGALFNTVFHDHLMGMGEKPETEIGI